MEIFPRCLTPGVVFLLTLLFGFWLSKSGKPYNGLLFNLHKLIALGTVVLTTMQISDILKDSDAQILLIVLILVIGLCVVALFTSGALMSLGKLNYPRLLLIHRVAPALGLFTMALTIYLLHIGRAL